MIDPFVIIYIPDSDQPHILETWSYVHLSVEEVNSNPVSLGVMGGRFLLKYSKNNNP